jgi:hypothetical protein
MFYLIYKYFCLVCHCIFSYMASNQIQGAL